MIRINADKKRPTIAIFIPSLENDYSNELCKGVIDACEEKDVNLVIFPGKPLRIPYEDQKQFNIIYEYADVSNIDALLLTSGSLCNYVGLKEYKKFYSKFSSIPMVSIAMELDDVVSILNDNKYGFRQAILHIIEKHGRRKIAFIKGSESNIEARERYQVYLDVLEEQGIPFDENLVFSGDFTMYSGIEAVEYFVDRKGLDFDAIVAANDEMALFAMEELQKRNYKIPEQVSVIGFDNIEGSRFSSPTLTTVNQPIYRHGRMAVYTALDLIQGKKVTNLRLKSEFVPRESCGCSDYLQEIMATEKRESYNNADKADEIERFLKINLPRLNENNFDINKITDFVYKCFTIDEVYIRSEDISVKLLNEFNSLANIKKARDEDVWHMVKFIADLKNILTKWYKDDYVLNKVEKVFYLINVQLMECTIKEHTRAWRQFYLETQSTRHILQLLMLNIQNKNKLFYSIVENLRKLSVGCGYIYIYDEEEAYIDNLMCSIPDKLKLVMGYNDNEQIDISDENETISKYEAFNNKYFDKSKRKTLIINPLVFKDEQLGLFITEFHIENKLLYESLVTQISCILKMYFLINGKEKIESKLKAAMKELEAFNSKLSRLSQVDELTGLYNRRGFMNLAQSALNLAQDMNKNGVLFFADMDGLKFINDTYGHEEGDSAIKEMAKILKKTFRRSDIIARIGGDEFNIFTTDLDLNYIKIKEDRVNELCSEYNNNSGKPYKISITLGMEYYGPHFNGTLEELMANADKVLYREKRKKKQGHKKDYLNKRILETV